MRRTGVAFLATAALAGATSPPINVSLRSSWNSPPFLVELLESFSLEFPNTFFHLLDIVSTPSSRLLHGQQSPRDIHQETFRLAAQSGILTDLSDLSAVDSTLALHAATPAIEALYNYYHDRHGKEKNARCIKEGKGASWVDWYGRVVCDVKELVELANAQTHDSSSTNEGGDNTHPSHSRPKLLAFDHVHPSPSRVITAPERTAILYADLGSSNFRSLHEYLYAQSQGSEPKIEYVLRHVPPNSYFSNQKEEGKAEDSRSSLTGYGVALDLKKTDYLVLDDRHSSGSGTADSQRKTSESTTEESDPLLNLLKSLPALEPKPIPRPPPLGKSAEVEEVVVDEAEEETIPPKDPNAPLIEAEILELGYKASQLIISTSLQRDNSGSLNDTIYQLTSAPTDFPFSLPFQQAHLSPLDMLTLLSQNFPKYAQTLARRIEVASEVEEELRMNSLIAQTGSSVVWVNGGMVITHGGEVVPSQLGGRGGGSAVDLLTLKRVLRRERGWVKSLEAIGMSRKEAVQVISDSGGVVPEQGKENGDAGKNKRKESQKKKGRNANMSDQVLDGRIDASDRSEGGDVILWWNDMDKDERYQMWSPRLMTLMRPMYPGSFPAVRRNLFNIILIMDFTKTQSLQFISGTMVNIVDRGLPLRFGLVPSIDTPEGHSIAKLLYYMMKETDNATTLEFLRRMMQSVEQSTENVSLDQIKAAFDAVIREYQAEADDELGGATFMSVTAGQSLPEGINAYIERVDARIGPDPSAPLGHAFFNGKYLEFSDMNDFIRDMQMEISYQLQYLQQQIYTGTMKDDDDITNWFYDQPGVSKRRNKYIIPATGNSASGDGNVLRIVSLPDTFDKTGVEWQKVKSGFLYPPGNGPTPNSVYVVADFDSEEGLDLVKEALSSLNEESRTRLTFIHNPSINGEDQKQTADHRPPSQLIAQLVMSGKLSGSGVNPQNFGKTLGIEVVPIEGVETMEEEQAQKPLGTSDSTSSLESLLNSSGGEAEQQEYLKVSRLLAREFGFTPGQSGLIVNGRIIGPIERRGFIAADFKALEEYEYSKRVEAAVETVERVCPWSLDADRAEYAELVSLTSSVLAAIQTPDPSEVGLFDAPPRPRQRTYHALARNLTMFTYGDSSTAMYHVVFVLNPLSETAQKWSSMITWLTAVPDVYIEVHLSPHKQQEIPLKRFYRYNAKPVLSFDNNGNEIPSQTIFDGLPTDPLYTLAMDVPSSWLVRPREALYDLDNIQLTQLSPSDTSVDAIFELDYLVIEGHARETVTQAAPRGLQLQLVNSRGHPIADTQVVANLGYLQFRAKPGVFRLEIREGKGREIYNVNSAGNEGWDSPTVESGGTEITLTSFDGLTLYPRFARNKGQEKADVLESDDLDGDSSGSLFEGVASRVKSLFQGAKQSKPSTSMVESNGQSEINIFTVASGLLYERFVGIMILSVLRNTNSTVKFWFIENFLSPSFLQVIPHMAKEYGFQYELVTYKWPSWLRAQREKQRIIWAYKILFLDVLFPMDLKKVIFVDADQIVRTDLKELVDLNLHGAPYAYTPMGDDNHDMEGFRFWKTGYWAETLQGKPYHISALYVVDLVRFRQDILRGQYQQLSIDPNSLANLDQDLPNNLQRLVPIHSLHEDWLWVSSKNRLDRAKTIDLCQNPLTKEPKLARARQIPEWEEYDAEIARFTRRLAEEGKVRSGIAAADANVLANAGNTQASPQSNDNADGKIKPDVNSPEENDKAASDHAHDEL
ncbi:glycosyltransferase family 24 protein [Amanita thiersii Skay4041]|uniref:Glycosyltransferase family 24 protein n=1 Tax=Amanita thiersii Skay4041 TaxID=703135 RepID=A0A2A9NKE7_9AGAR|nr:glycosyltransferase family 24 protein [Amanita thiersii Skay4041]